MLLATLDFGPGSLAYFALVLLVAAYIRGLAGFGLSAVLVSGLSFVVDPVEAVAFALIAELAASSMLARSVWNDIEWSRLSVLLAAGLIGTPIGVQILTTADPSTVRGLTFGAIGAISVALLTVRPRSVSQSLLSFFLVGVIAGVANGAAALSGLVIVLALTLMSIAPAEMRATLVAYFFFADLAVAGMLYLRGGYDSSTFWRLAAGLPVMAAALWAGTHTFDRSSPERLRRVALGVLVAVCAVGLGRLAAS